MMMSQKVPPEHKPPKNGMHVHVFCTRCGVLHLAHVPICTPQCAHAHISAPCARCCTCAPGARCFTSAPGEAPRTTGLLSFIENYIL